MVKDEGKNGNQVGDIYRGEDEDKDEDKDGSKRYERVGVGKVKPQIVSMDCTSGTLW